MPAIAPPPVPPRVLPRVASPPALTRAAAQPRTLAHYVQFFALDIAALRGRDVLDVGAGASSFVAEDRARRVDAVGVDPLYGSPPHAVAAHVCGDAGASPTSAASGPGASDESPAMAAQRFLTNYETHFTHGHYVSGALPRLPFFDDTFDLVLCGHLLFVSPGEFNFDWHLAALRELVRVSAGEVRVYPLCGTHGRPHPKLGTLRRELQGGGIVTEMRTLSADLPAGARTMLSLRRSES